MSNAIPAPGPLPELRLGVSSCLLGEEVRFDGSHKRDRFILGTMSKFFSFVPVCPELEIGLGVPRESLRLIQASPRPRLYAPRSGSDHTERMVAYAERQVADLQAGGLAGFILKRASPTCGMERVRVYDANDVPQRIGVGTFASVLMKRWPLLPVEEEGRLHDPVLRENFFDRAFGYHRLQTLFGGRWSRGDLVKFHTAEKYLLLSHDNDGYTELGRLVARQAELDDEALAAEYSRVYMQSLATQTTRKKHVNVLQHMLGYFRGRLPDDVRRRLERSVEDYRQELVPLVVPVTLIRHYVEITDVPYLAGQHYLEPHPRELLARNHV